MRSAYSFDSYYPWFHQSPYVFLTTNFTNLTNGMCSAYSFDSYYPWFHQLQYFAVQKRSAMLTPAPSGIAKGANAVETLFFFTVTFLAPLHT